MDSKNICAVIDSQGFCLPDRQFVPREIAFVCKKFSVYYEVIAEVTDELKAHFKKEFDFQEYFIHGLPIHQLTDDSNRKTIKQSQLPQLILELYESCMANENSSIALKNVFLEKYLSNLSIPFYNLEIFSIGGEMCPTLEMFGSFANSFFCVLHSNIRKKPPSRCALKKASSIWHWLSNKIVSDDLIGSIVFMDMEARRYRVPLY